MNKEPPKKVYSNNRLKKIQPAARPINDKRQSCHQHTSTAISRGTTEAKICKDTKDRSLHYSRSQSKYEKHFEPISSNATSFQALNEHSDVKKVFPNLKDPSTLGDLGIPLKHFYVQRKSTSNNRESLQLVCKKSKKNLDQTELEENFFPVGHDQSATNSVGLPFQGESPNKLVQKSNSSDPHNASEFFQMVKATLEDTFEEIVKDCPEFLTTSLNAKENLIKKLRSYTQKKKVVGDYSNNEYMSTGGSAIQLQSIRPQGFDRFPGEPSTETKAIEPKLQLNYTTATSMSSRNSWTPSPYCFKTRGTPREFLPRSRRYTGSVTNVSERMPSDTIQMSSKGSSIFVNRSVSLSQTCRKNNVGETDKLTDACLPIPNPCQLPFFPPYPKVYGNGRVSF